MTLKTRQITLLVVFFTLSYISCANFFINITMTDYFIFFSAPEKLIFSFWLFSPFAVYVSMRRFKSIFNKTGTVFIIAVSAPLTIASIILIMAIAIDFMKFIHLK